MNITLVQYENELSSAIELIKGFWQEHSGYTQSDDETLSDLKDWTKERHVLYFICLDNEKIGFVHLGSRGAKTDWLENIFVLPKYQGKGIGTEAISLVENVVKEYSQSLYIEAAARNKDAIRLYRRTGFDCLNTVTLRKDFHREDFEKISSEKILGLDFDVKRKKTDL